MEELSITPLPQKQSPSGKASESDIVFSGFELGMADSAEQGTQLMKNVNIISASGEASVNFAMAALTKPPTVSALSATFTGASDLITSVGAVSAGIFNGCAVFFGSTSGGVVAGQVYYVKNLSGNTFQITDHLSTLGSVVNITDDTNTISTFVIGAMKFATETWATNPSVASMTTPHTFMQDANGRLWFLNSSNQLIYCGNEDLTNAGGNGICSIGGAATTPGYISVFRQDKIDMFNVDAVTNTTVIADNWTTDWQTITGYIGVSHQAIEGKTFNGIMFCNATTVGTVLLGTSVFDPTNSSTYDFNTSALLLPTQDRTNWIASLDTVFLVGGLQSTIYTWGGPNSNLSLYEEITVPENKISSIVSAGANAYIFAGVRGNIYITNGSNVSLFKKFPDQVGPVAVTTEPYILWGGTRYWRNQLLFGIQFLANDGTNSQNSGGVWAIDTNTGALRHINETSAGSTSTTPVIAPIVFTQTPGGFGIYAASTSFNGSTFAVDRTTTSPYVAGETIIRTRLANVATFYTPRTFAQCEYKLSRPLVASESVAIGWRPYLSQGTFTSMTSDSTQLGAMSGTFITGIEGAQYVQLEITLTSTASTPSFCRLTEVRLR